MTELAVISLENEMDLTLAYKRSILTAAMLGLTAATQTAFATAVSEVCREVIDKGTGGIAVLGTATDAGRFFLSTRITCRFDEDFSRNNEGFEYARKLVPLLEITSSGDVTIIYLQMGIPRATRIDQRKVNEVKRQIELDGPVSAYEEVKQRNASLTDQNQQQELALVHATYLDQQKNEFLSMVSHELNSPITVLRSYSQIALASVKSDEQIKPMLSKIEFQTGKLMRLVRQLMDVSKIEHGKLSYDLEAISVNEFLNDVIEPVKLLVGDHKVIMTLHDDARVHIDVMRIEQVLNNLVNNAAKYSEAGSTIQISTSLSDDSLTIIVEDEGIGMSPETQQQVFDKFYRDKQIERKISGLGMGLYIASRIVADHKGSMQVNSEEGKGSIFAFTLPLLLN